MKKLYSWLNFRVIWNALRGQELFRTEYETDLMVMGVLQGIPFDKP